jgi:hypothetical protein
VISRLLVVIASVLAGVAAGAWLRLPPPPPPQAASTLQIASASATFCARSIFEEFAIWSFPCTFRQVLVIRSGKYQQTTALRVAH